jgi:hypothetical protein
MLKGWKTIAFNVLTGILLVLTTQGVDVWGLSPEIIGTVTIVGNFILRLLTTTKVGSSE